MSNDYNRYTFVSGHLHTYYDDPEIRIVLYYNPKPTNTDPIMKSIMDKYDVKANYTIMDGNLRIYDPNIAYVDELEDIQKAYNDQFGKELNIVIDPGDFE